MVNIPHYGSGCHFMNPRGGVQNTQSMRLKGRSCSRVVGREEKEKVKYGGGFERITNARIQ